MIPNSPSPRSPRRTPRGDGNRATQTDARGSVGPLVSVVIPVYNQADYVIGAVDSVLAQDYPAIELIVVDDGSTDDTPRRLSEHGGSFRVIRQVNRGAAAALNVGIRESRGTLVCWLSADDLFLGGKIRAQVRAFTEDPGLGLVYTGYERIRADGSHIETLASPAPAHSDPFVTVFWRNSINGSSVMMPRAVFDECGPFDEDLRADVDADMWLRLTQRYRVHCLDGVFLSYRIHANTLSANEDLMTASMTEVRRRQLRSGSLRHALETREPQPQRLAAWMAADFAMQGLHDLAVDLLALSFAIGRDWPAQLVARWTVRLTPVARRSRVGAVLTWPVRFGISVLRSALTTERR